MEKQDFIPSVEKLISCNPKGEFNFVNVKLLRQLIDNCLADIEDEQNGAIACNKLLSVANQCYKCKYYHTALGLYERVTKIAFDDWNATYTFRCQQYAYAAAKRIDDIWRITAPNEKRKSQFSKTVYAYMLHFDDFRYCFLNDDNIERFERIHEYGRRHGITTEEAFGITQD
jgi:hypothetical protein